MMITTHNNFYQTGFTLLELLVAITVFSTMSVMAYGGLSNVIDNSRNSEQAMERLQALQTAITIITRDITQISKRDIRDEYGNLQAYLQTDHNPDLIMEFSRNGLRNPAGLPRSSYVRIAYQLEQNTLYRLTWPQLDRAPDTKASSNEIIDKVNAVEMRYREDQGSWHNRWPPLNTNTQAGAPAPVLVAVEIMLELEDIGKIKRLYEVMP